MRTIIHDLNENNLKKLKFNKNDKIINALECENHCIGCFSCWTKHPTKCIYQDNFSNIASYIKDSNEFIIITDNKFGCFSSSVKKVLERCIGYVLPYFTIRDNMIHHKLRYNKQLSLKVYVYGNINKEEIMSFNALTRAVSINIGTTKYKAYFINNIKEIDNVYIN